MFRDKSLMPKEAIRLAALGLLGHGPMRYGELANEVRHFTCGSHKSYLPQKS